jgi:outer membrane protein assembly factor BamE (lipoprotein component of BamABCDE complex)
MNIFQMTNQNQIGAFQYLILLSCSLFISAGLSGCVSAGYALDEVAYNRLRVGQQQAEVRKIFGDPKQSKNGSNGKSMDVFMGKFPLIGSRFDPVHGAEIRTLSVLYGTTGTVEQFFLSVGNIRAINDKNWNAGRLVVANELKQIRRGVTSREAVLGQFGPPTIEQLTTDGNTMLSWIFLEGVSGKTDRVREFLVVLEGDRVVKDYLLRDFRR